MQGQLPEWILNFISPLSVVFPASNLVFLEVGKSMSCTLIILITVSFFNTLCLRLFFAKLEPIFLMPHWCVLHLIMWFYNSVRLQCIITVFYANFLTLRLNKTYVWLWHIDSIAWLIKSKMHSMHYRSQKQTRKKVCVCVSVWVPLSLRSEWDVSATANSSSLLPSTQVLMFAFDTTDLLFLGC